MCAVGVGQRFHQTGAEDLEIHGATKRFKLIAEVAQLIQRIIDDGNSSLDSRQFMARPAITTELKTSRKIEVDRSVHAVTTSRFTKHFDDRRVVA